ncbi:D-alanine-D-alanine ligase-like ATP-grasp enzyme [Alkalihalobacillus xiaoxiensis]|uniref:D-alanine-D-alanine ligase-like ATP-grasp enzyme n=1 Tax=Shouchella xiaoxiensis TaxID=766895 RepID=A0ABS2SZR6_9BACI|nr:D-alanine-D-alanine ligase-like ATP-grasp enzyme [Shouchella xiaoxiensis]
MKEEITNLSKGGNALSLKQTVFKDEKDIRAQINRACKRMTQALEAICPEDCFIELGIDLALDEKQNKLFLIEVNFRPGYKGLKIIDQQAYYRVCWAPFSYSAYQQGFK